jgi:transcriptional regulator with XRE-family HTH domain
MTDKELMHDTRTRLHLTQSEMAEKVGYCNQSKISDIERGEKKLSNVAREFLLYIRDNELNNG